MSQEDLTILLSHAGSLGLGGVVGGTFIYFLLKSFIPGYLSKKAENLATREDIAKITHEVERVRSHYSVLLEEVRAKQQLRLAAVDRRLDAHQQAYSLWRQLLANLHQEGIEDAVIECQKWWDKNCLYLSPEARRAFYTADQCVFSHASYLQTPPPQQNKALIQSNWKSIIDAGELL